MTLRLGGFDGSGTTRVGAFWFGHVCCRHGAFLLFYFILKPLPSNIAVIVDYMMLLILLLLLLLLCLRFVNGSNV